MPRKNRTIPHTPYTPAANDSNKRRYPTKKMAQTAADTAMLLSSDLELSVYQGVDGGWYLTSKQSS